MISLILEALSLTSVQENLKKHGNFWGPIKRDVDRTFGCKWIAFRIEVRSKKNFMGRFGGGWNVKVGLQFSRLSYILVFLGIGTLTIASGRTSASELLERASRRVS